MIAAVSARGPGKHTTDKVHRVNQNRVSYNVDQATARQESHQVHHWREVGHQLGLTTHGSQVVRLPHQRCLVKRLHEHLKMNGIVISGRCS